MDINEALRFLFIELNAKIESSVTWHDQTTVWVSIWYQGRHYKLDVYCQSSSDDSIVEGLIAIATTLKSNIED